ncbi:hypothetical protein [Peptostreptococcus equinus]|uniref:Uncharacterized protein n=1 Tax=Peptostreptococcus equinus TaxID=3003601 RepID=A0ABY7JUC3_9FIRM|nr:hypothetical protein [Peptostreptococcus sp. CBA3647]WAW15693.1 hypothetical protein O0R46_04385 [Peptostreptococcus sp. CBA3647]
MAKKNSKKREKAYYDKKIIEAKNTKETSDLSKNRLFVMSIGFLILFYSNYLAIFISQKLVAILGLGVMLYAMIKSLKNPNEKIRQTKTGNYIDYTITAIIVLIIIFNIFLIIKHYI